jgi:hypothetical protein
MSKTFLFAIAIVLLFGAIAVGYSFGYDHGFEAAVSNFLR